MNKRLPTTVKLLRTLCAVLMLSLGFAHKPIVAVAAPVGAFDEAYRLPDGSFAEICAVHTDIPNSHDTGKANHPGTALPLCEACRLVTSILLPTPDTTSWARATSASLENTPVLYNALVHDVDRQRPKARAPPSFL